MDFTSARFHQRATGPERRNNAAFTRALVVSAFSRFGPLWYRLPAGSPPEQTRALASPPVRRNDHRCTPVNADRKDAEPSSSAFIRVHRRLTPPASQEDAPSRAATVRERAGREPRRRRQSGPQRHRGHREEKDGEHRPARLRTMIAAPWASRIRSGGSGDESRRSGADSRSPTAHPRISGADSGRSGGHCRRSGSRSRMSGDHPRMSGSHPRRPEFRPHRPFRLATMPFIGRGCFAGPWLDASVGCRPG